MRACEQVRKPRATVSPKASDEEKLLVGYVKDYLKQFHDAIDEMKEICNRQDSLESAHEQNAKYVKSWWKSLKRSQKTRRAQTSGQRIVFEDLQHKALELLSHDEYELSGDFDAVFVDEYQDVNPTQEAIIRKLVKGECFMVGDVKQSIYGFRLADPAIFISRQNAYEESVKRGRTFISTAISEARTESSISSTVCLTAQ